MKLVNHFKNHSDLQSVPVELVQRVAIEQDFKDVGFVDVLNRRLFAPMQSEFSQEDKEARRAKKKDQAEVFFFLDVCVCVTRVEVRNHYSPNPRLVSLTALHSLWYKHSPDYSRDEG